MLHIQVQFQTILNWCKCSSSALLRYMTVKRKMKTNYLKSVQETMYIEPTMNEKFICYFDTLIRI